MAQPVQVRLISNDEGNRLLRIVRRGIGSVVTWRRAQMVLLSAQRMPVAKIAVVTFTSPDRVRDVIHNFNTDGFDSLYPRYAGGRPPKFDLKQRAKIKQIALSREQHHLGPPPGHHRAGAAAHDAQQPVVLVIADRPDLHGLGHLASPAGKSGSDANRLATPTLNREPIAHIERGEGWQPRH